MLAPAYNVPMLVAAYNAAARSVEAAVRGMPSYESVRPGLLDAVVLGCSERTIARRRLQEIVIMFARSFHSLAGLTVLALCASLGGCASPSEEGGESGSAAQTAVSEVRFKGADYEYAQVVTFNGDVRGKVSTSVGDPEHGGASCAFTFSGHIVMGDDGHEEASISATDGYDEVQGTLRAEKKGAGAAPDLLMKLPASINACWRFFADGVIALTDSKPLGSIAGVAGFAPVRVDKTYFHNAPKEAARAAYVVKGDIVVIKAQPGGGIVKDGFVQVDFINAQSAKTTGWLSYADLASPWATGE